MDNLRDSADVASAATVVEELDDIAVSNSVDEVCEIKARSWATWFSGTNMGIHNPSVHFSRLKPGRRSVAC